MKETPPQEAKTMNTKTKTTHTPTPWLSQYNGENWHITDGHSFVASLCGNSKIDATNAAFIVRAVNSHESLVNACGELLGLCSSNGINDSRMDIARKAIAKAEGR
jgi:hypothetical protein